MSFANFKVFALALVLLSFSVLCAEQIPFTLDSQPQPATQNLEDPSVQTPLIADLKFQAVRNWLQQYLGPRFANYDKEITPDFAERFILDYRVSHTPQNALELSGHLDGDSLKSWVRISEAKSKGSQELRPLFVYSSTILALQASPAQTAQSINRSSTASWLYRELGVQFQKYNAHLASLSGGLSLSGPPQTDADLKPLAQTAANLNDNLVVWANLVPCAYCGNARADIYLYSFPANHIAAILSQDIALSDAEMANSQKLHTALVPLLQQFHQKLDTLLSRGQLFSTPYALVVEGIDPYALFHSLDQGLKSADFLNDPLLKGSEPDRATFEVLSQLSAQDLSQRIATTDFGGFHLKPTHVDSKTIVVRYLK